MVEIAAGPVRCSVRDGVALITLNRPEARYAMSDKLTPALRTQIGYPWSSPVH